MTISSTTMRAAMQAYVACINAGDPAGVCALFAPDAVIEDPVGSPPKTGAAIADWFADTVAYGTHISPVAPVRTSHGNAAALAFDVTFTPPGSLAQRIRSIDVCMFDENGLITSLKGYWGPDDMETM